MSEEKKASEIEAKKPKKKLSTLKKVLIGVVAFFVIIFGWAYFASLGAVKVADEFVGYIQDANSSSAYDLFTQDAKDVVPQDDFKDLVEQIGPILNGEAKNVGRGISDSTDKDATSKITYKIPGSDGETYYFEVFLVKKDGEWKVNKFESLTQENYDAKKAEE